MVLLTCVTAAVLLILQVQFTAFNVHSAKPHAAASPAVLTHSREVWTH